MIFSGRISKSRQGASEEPAEKIEDSEQKEEKTTEEEFSGEEKEEDGETKDSREEEDCYKEGESFPVVPGAKRCCEGLSPISCDKKDSEGICHFGCVGVGICAKCGNGVCGPGENECKCPQDCDKSRVCDGMSLEKAKYIAKYKSDCDNYGDFDFSMEPLCKETPDGWIWWIMMKDVIKPNCGAACVVNTTTEKGKINWMCGGVVQPD